LKLLKTKKQGKKMKKVTPKAHDHDTLGRFREVISDPNNVRIPRVHDAGVPAKDPRFSDHYVPMHNGIKVLIGVDSGYYGDFSQLLLINRGVHEPQEEYAFMKIMEHVNPDLPMLELGAYWGFYSLWYKKECPSADVYLMEPDKNNLRVGMKNFELNGEKATFINDLIGDGGMDVNDFMASNEIEKLGILHADIQGAEMHLLEAISDSMDQKRFEVIFISTHSQDLHIQCLNKLEQHGYKIICHADFDNETFCADGIIVACVPEKDIEPFDIYSRSKHSIDSF
jgi:hypothetical protein